MISANASSHFIDKDFVEIVIRFLFYFTHFASAILIGFLFCLCINSSACLLSGFMFIFQSICLGKA